ncbi:MAG: N-6 DNA methylase [Candidatus Woesearchaeota archaeon]|jgi:23S rRNA G2445 N2-methylase RlmL
MTSKEQLKALIYCNKGLEDVCLNEIKEISKYNCELFSRIVVCDVSDVNDICKLAMKSQTANRVCLSLGTISKDEGHFEFTEEFRKIIDGKSIAVRTYDSPEGSIDTPKLAKIICDEFDKNEIKYSVDLKNPNLFIQCFESDGNYFVGLDFSFDLNKRDYLIFSHNQALRPTIAYSLVKLSGFNGKGILLDPFCGGGTIVIEATLEVENGIHYHDFDKLEFNKFVKDVKYEEIHIKNDAKIVGYDVNLSTITAARKNAKIAGINKDVDFSVVDCYFLDTKFETKTVDYIVTHPPMLSKFANEKKILKTWDDFLFISHDILKKKMVVILNRIEEFKEIAIGKYKFKLVEEREIYQGEMKMFVVVLEK